LGAEEGGYGWERMVGRNGHERDGGHKAECGRNARTAGGMEGIRGLRRMKLDIVLMHKAMILTKKLKG
jgi:hypothetical protein